ncbi:hypothetical protein DFH09DRAFT_1340798 [Mycena vulgaris]|nr:hypothetical protein DFH09DRAFT_1340798 [Mycena vulgaris]
MTDPIFCLPVPNSVLRHHLRVRGPGLTMTMLNIIVVSSVFGAIIGITILEHYFSFPIRSYREISRFVQDNKYNIDLENRALFLTVKNQR